MRACQTDACFSQIIGSGLRSPVVRHSGSRCHRVASAGPRPSPSRQLKQPARDISVCCLFWTVFSRTGAEKLFGFSEPAPQIPDRRFRHFWLWFDPSALGVNVDRTLNVGHSLSGQYDEFTAQASGRKAPGLFSLSPSRFLLTCFITSLPLSAPGVPNRATQRQALTRGESPGVRSHARLQHGADAHSPRLL